MNQKMPVIFFGHGSPMLALEKSPVTEEIQEIGKSVLKKFGKPHAILCISAHWYTNGSFVQKEKNPEQIYDMYGFPDALYQVKYPVPGDPELGGKIMEILGDAVKVNDDWGIDHGTWTVLVHAFPKADIPVVQLSVNSSCTAEEHFAMGKKLRRLREEGYLIIGSGNIVHNLRRVEWKNPGGTEKAEQFNRDVIDRLQKGDFESLVHYKDLEHQEYAVPTPDHYVPLLYILGACDQEEPTIFNDVCNLGAIAMTSVAFGL